MKLIAFNSKTEHPSYAIIIPAQLIKGFGWKQGDKIKHRITGEGKIELSKE